jgi:uncharacterized protein YfaS (alpha-2-macroglobulin family)
VRSIILLLPLLVFLQTAAVPAPDAQTFDALKAQAEQSYAEKSFARAHELYEKAAGAAHDDAHKRWITMRLADTAWRAAAAPPSADNTIRETARASLEGLIRESGDEHDRVWAEAEESVGDLLSQQSYGVNLTEAGAHDNDALEWWAGSPDLPLARRRYLDIVYRMARWRYNYYPAGDEDVSTISRDVLANAMAVAESPDDQAHTRLLLGKKLLQENRPDSVERGLEILGEVVARGKTTTWYAEALILSADRLVQGVPVTSDDGAIGWKSDYPRALGLYRRIVNDFKRGETKYYERANSAIQQIVSPSVRVMIASTFLPASEQQIALAWRNVKEVTFTIRPLDVIDDGALEKGNPRDLTAFRTRVSPIRKWTLATNDVGDYAPGQQMIRLTPKLDPGAYLIDAISEGSSSFQRLLVTDANILVHMANDRADLFVCSAITGEPIPNARIRTWQQKSGSEIAVHDLRSDANGLATAVIESPSQGMLAIAATAGKSRQATLSTYAYNYRYPAEQWRIYAFTDRPAYRPEETVHWKIIARTRPENEWITPARETIDYEIDGPRNEKVASGTATLNEFGSFWTDLPLTRSMALGTYRIVFRKRAARDESIGSAALFQLEEYKLPEFRVEVTTHEDHGQKKLYRSGDTVEATIDASYYFGGPVANADVEVEYVGEQVRHQWHPWREYDWYYDSEPNYGESGESKTVKLKTDANGRAELRIDTSPDDADSEYAISARVTDSSRREVEGRGNIRVGRQSYSVVARAGHCLYAPADKVTVDFKVLDANDQPVQAAGTAKVIRRTWDEVWVDPMGHEVSGRALAHLRAAAIVFPPPADPPWRPKFTGYRDEEITAVPLTAGKDGLATMTFMPPRDGYYAVQWTSVDRKSAAKVRARDVVTAETAVWVSQRSVSEIGYHAAGLQIILDKETFRSGGVAPVMIATPNSGQWVFFTTSADGILESQLLHLDGTVKLVQIPLDDRHTPSFFITASSVYDRTLATESVRVVVPPVAHFLHVDVRTDHDEYRPRSEGLVTVTTRDVDGKPVSAEVALSLSDESVTAIAGDPAGDPRKFFFENRYGTSVRPVASVQTQRYVTLIEEKGKLIDERERAARNELKKEKDEVDGEPGGVVGGVAGHMSMDLDRNSAKAPPPPPAKPQAVAEAITVTAAAAPMMQDALASLNQQAIDVIVRSDFRSTAFWQPDVITGRDGVAVVKVRFPETLTTWRATARAVSAATQVGMSTATARTSMPMLVRLEAPRFFVAGDRATVSAVVNNNTDQPLRVRPSIVVEGVTLAGNGATAPVEVPPHGESRADWTVVAEHAGAAKLRVTGVTEGAGAFSDAMEKPFTVYEHGIDKLVAHSGKLRGEEAGIRLDLPAARRDTSLVVQIQPSLATTMLDALPYLIDYPYGCTEQTMSRFLPAAIVARTLAKNGLTRSDIEGRMFGGIEPSTAARTHPGQGKGLSRLDPVMVESKERLLDFQHNDGGWGWWKEGDSDPFMTAYVVWGFAVLRQAGGEAPSEVDRAIAYLDTNLVKYEDDGQSQAWMLHALAAWRAATGSGISTPERRAFDNVFGNRQQLTGYSRALLALAAHDFHDNDHAAVLVRNLEDGVKVDRSPDRSVLVHGSGSGAAETMATAHWGEDRFWWRWSDGPVESTSFALQALIAIDPKNALIEPAMNWLVKNRRGAQWNNTRDSAIAILALDDYLRSSGELGADVSYELSVNGCTIASRHLTSAEILGAPGRFTIDPGLVHDANEIRIRRTGGSSTAPIYFAVEGRFVSLEEPVKAAGNEIFVRRDYFRLAPHPTLLKGTAYDREPLRDGGSVDGSDRVEVVVTIETKNDYDYLLLEDLKPGGLEAVALRSGEPLAAQELTSKTVARKFESGQPPAEKTSIARRVNSGTTGRSAYVYQELRDRKIAMFIDHLPQGIWEIRYTLRAEVPGSFHALPLIGQAMYVPEIHANSDEIRVEVK